MQIILNAIVSTFTAFFWSILIVLALIGLLTLCQEFNQMDSVKIGIEQLK